MYASFRRIRFRLCENPLQASRETQRLGSVFLIDDGRELEAALGRDGFEYRIEIDGLRNLIECVSRGS